MAYMHKTYSFYLISCISVLLFGCNKFEFSPYQTEVAVGMPSNLNNINIAKLKVAEAASDDTVTILYSGDSQRFYDELKELVSKVNTRPDIDFLVLCGDISDFGMIQEFLWITDELKKLQIPYLCAVGNHDLIANGSEIYTKIFGEKNYSFTYKGYKFLFHDTNGREYGFNGTIPNLWWINTELKDATANWFVGMSHIPPNDPDFDPALQIPYKDLLASKPNFILSLHGHLHVKGDSYLYDDHVRYMTSNSVDKKEAVLLKLINGKIIKEYLTY